MFHIARVPGGLVGYSRAYRNHFCEFNSHRVHILVGTFSCKKVDWRKAQERELATFDENRREVGVEWVRAVCARLGRKVVAVEGLTDVLADKSKIN